MASIHLQNVSVSFPVLSADSRSLKRKIIGAGVGGRIGWDEDNHVLINALNNISIDIEHGERVGLVGHNGAGKTTLLRVMAGIYEPQQGEVVVKGRVAPLFDVGMGMDPEISGHDNIMLRGLYLGMSKAEIESRTDDIVAFTELGPFMEMPIRTYSAGMQARLAFAISTSIQPEILLLDEGIGAGDAEFLEKSRDHLDAFAKRARILVLASHSEALIRQLCTKAILLERGSVVCGGEIDDVYERYHRTA